MMRLNYSDIEVITLSPSRYHIYHIGPMAFSLSSVLSVFYSFGADSTY